jgi:FxLD family lantipeptide
MSDHPARTNDDFDLDLRIVQAGDAVDAMLCSTDNGCDTQAGGDC